MIWSVWGVIAIILLIVELVTVDFTFLMLSGGAIVAALISLGTDSLILQVLGFAVVSIVLLIFVRPVIKRHIVSKEGMASNIYALIGQHARTLTLVNTDGGRVKIGGDEWSAKTIGSEIPAGEDALITAVYGVQLVVEPPPATAVS